MIDEGTQPYNITYSTIITCAKKCNIFNKVVHWFKRMYKTGLMPDEVTYSAILDVYVMLAKVEEVINLYEKARATGWKPDNITFSVLGKLHHFLVQDQVPPFPLETATTIVEEELGSSSHGIFDQFDYEPIAATSLGQAHRAKLKGQNVVVKVQRPGLKGLFDIDIKNLRVIAEYLQKVDPKSDGAKRDWIAIYDECASVLYQAGSVLWSCTCENQGSSLINKEITKDVTSVVLTGGIGWPTIYRDR
ncbi:hypothetical protein TanjilG_19379 [Lupinus angustifolius]|uniref:ABC1 atypical kinase-like domain-containing protein n=1 Tax=Lupinus angustifolius TaxID=3871 RepID=A0A1J7HYS0_LUPAN|nr:hypothetical protein TanjilG_19379 [Lupinus angustifolius]